MERYDCAVIGTGPAGLEAAVNLKIRGKSFILFGPETLSAKVGLAPKVENYLGFPEITGHELVWRFASHLEAMSIEPVGDQVSMVYSMGGYFAIAAGRLTYEATTVILATGAAPERELPGESEFLGRGVSYCATCDAPLYRGKTCAVVAYTSEAASEAEFVGELAAVTYYVPVYGGGPVPGGNIEIVKGLPKEIKGDRKARELVMDSGTLEADGFFIIRDSIAPSSLLPGLEVEGGYIKVDAAMRTNIPGCFAAGDCTGKPHQFMRAAGQGQTAALNAVSYISEMKKK